MIEDKSRFRTNTKAGLPRARARYLEQSIRLEETKPHSVIRASVYLTALFIFLSIAWASITQVSEVAISSGEVVPADLIHRVQHYEGGIVNEILVRNGDYVEQGDVLLRLLPSASQSDLEQMKSRSVTLRLKIERLHAMLGQREPVFGTLAEEIPSMVAKELEVKHILEKNVKDQNAVIESEIRQRETELIRQRNRMRALEREVKLAQKQVSLREPLLANKLVPQSEVLSLKSQLAALQSDYKEAADGIHVAQNAIGEAKSRLAEAISTRRSKLVQEAAGVRAELAEVEQALVKHHDRVRRLAVIAPVAGIIEGLEINSINAVIKSGEDILKIIPTSERLIVESRVSTQDIGHVHVGQSADVKINSYDPMRFGSVKGVVERISATSYLDETREPYFLAQIALNKNFIGDNPKRFVIVPGMTVMADIQTGSKSILEYILKPVTRGFTNAFRER